MRKMIIAGVAGTFLAGSAAMAGEPLALTEDQMDSVTAGFLSFRIVAGGAETEVDGRNFRSSSRSIGGVYDKATFTPGYYGTTEEYKTVAGGYSSQRISSRGRGGAYGETEAGGLIVEGTLGFPN